jgi:hypothetical protein
MIRIFPYLVADGLDLHHMKNFHTIQSIMVMFDPFANHTKDTFPISLIMGCYVTKRTELQSL